MKLQSYARTRRALGIVAGVLTHAAFGVTVWHLYAFLGGKSPAAAGAGGLWTDGLLALQFAVVHSLLLYPRVREALAKWIAAPFYGLFYCAATCGALAVVFALWRTSPNVWWEVRGLLRLLVEAAWFGSWAALFYSLYLNGLGYQTGWTPWWRWARRVPPEPRPFRPRGAYLLMRHPVYLSFLGLVWFTPVMTPDRAVLIAVWTVYVFIGSWLKDQRLVRYIGEPYRRYLARVPGYPGWPAGPLGKQPFDAPPLRACTLAAAASPACAGGHEAPPPAADQVRLEMRPSHPSVSTLPCTISR